MMGDEGGKQSPDQLLDDTMTVIELIEQPARVLAAPTVDRPSGEPEAVTCYETTCQCGKRIVRHQAFPLESRLRDSCYSCASS